MGEQLLLFHYEKTDIEELDESLTQVIEKLDRYRKSMHAKLSTLSSQVRTLEARIDVQDAQLYILKAFIDKHLSIKEEFVETLSENLHGIDI
jgi:predicted RNase H-like nuclease (RuvC/YqgF family)